MAKLCPNGVSIVPFFVACPKFSILICLATDLKNGAGSIYSGDPEGEKPGCTITLSDEDFMEMVMGKMDPQQVSIEHDV